jgi:hypothetical protein
VKRYPLLVVEGVWDDNHLITEDLVRGDRPIPSDVEKEVCFFLARLIQNFGSVPQLP